MSVTSDKYHIKNRSVRYGVSIFFEVNQKNPSNIISVAKNTFIDCTGRNKTVFSELPHLSYFGAAVLPIVTITGIVLALCIKIPHGRKAY